MDKVLENIKAAFTETGWGVLAAEWVLLFLLTYFVFRILKDCGARHLIAVYILSLLATGAIFLFTERMDAAIYSLFLLSITLFFLLLFGTEVRKTIVSGKWGTGTSLEHMPRSASAARAEECISSIVRAVQNLSKNNTGALIVFTSGNFPKEIIDSGVVLNANISNQLIEGIFINKAPLHDGALIIQGDKIRAAGCFLPLTQKDLPKDYGTRHRAGIGVTEAADASTIIVSEETGIVSVVSNGEITRYADSELLKKFLRTYYLKEFNEGKKS